MAKEIVISGISCRLPESDDMEEFQKNLFDGVDMVTDDNCRWPSGIYGLPKRMGTLRDLSRFDAVFFGIPPKMVHEMNPQARILLELTYEAILDAGVNPTEIRGSKTGVYIGMVNLGPSNPPNMDPEELTGYSIVGESKALFANRISYTFDFKGPSYSVDAACASGFTALQNAVLDIKTGQCDAAIVGGTNLLMNPFDALNFMRLKMLSADGKCKCFDSSADGYTRAEGIVVIYLQRASEAKRIYATVVGTKVNTDGYKSRSITYPSGTIQKELYRDIYAEFGVDPLEVSYVEAHGTGTPAGDPEEVNALADFFCKHRKEELAIGSVKSNIGHTESSSGLCGLAKVIIAMESGVIPANLHFETANANIPALNDGRLKVVVQHQTLKEGLVAVNSFGIGGENVHIILKRNSKSKEYPSEKVHRVVSVSGRTREAVSIFLDYVEKHQKDKEFLALVDSIHRNKINGFPYRGYTVMGDKPTREVEECNDPNRPIWFIFSGMGSQWPSMAKDLMQIKIFQNSINHSIQLLKPLDVDLEQILLHSSESTFDNILNSFVAITSVQVALTDLLKSLEINPDGIIGHSFGESACAYADGTFTAEQAVLAAYYRGRVSIETQLIDGAMAAVGLSLEEMQKRCPPEVFIACHNSQDNVTISGPTSSISTLVDKLKAENVFAKIVKTANIAFHSKYVAELGPKLQKFLEGIIPNPKPRSSKWISSSIPQPEWENPLARLSSADYHVNNLLCPVLFHESIAHIPENAIALEIAPTGLLQAILKRALGPKATNISLVKKGHEDNLHFLTSSLGKLYNAGAQPNFSKLYTPITFPVGRGTTMLSPAIKWDHSEEWTVPLFARNKINSSEIVVKIDIKEEKHQYLAGHVVDKKILFPASGYLVLVWKALATLRNADFEQLPVVFEDVKFSRTTILSDKNSTYLSIVIMTGSGRFEVCEGGSMVASGKIRVPDNTNKEALNLKLDFVQDNLKTLYTDDVYKEFRVRGHGFQGVFRGIVEVHNRGTVGKLRWSQNWVSYIDTMFQMSIFNEGSQSMFILIRLQKIVIDPKEHLQYVNGFTNDHPLVHTLGDVKVIKSGGIEVRGLNFSPMPTRLHAKPNLEKCEFMPFENNVSLEDENDALTALLQTVIENHSDPRMKILENVLVDTLQLPLVVTIKQILEQQPFVSVDINITSEVVDLASLEAYGVSCHTDSINQLHLLIFVGALAQRKREVLEVSAGSLAEGGFILLEEPKGTELNISNGFVLVSSQSTKAKIYFLLRKVMQAQLNADILSITGESFDWVEPLKVAMKKSERKAHRIYLFVENNDCTGLVGLVKCLKREPGGSGIRAFFIQDSNTPQFSLEQYSTQIRKDLVHNVLKKNVWGFFCHTPLKQNRKKVQFAYINCLIRSNLSTLKWIEQTPPHYTHDWRNNLCTISYATLNFRDVMLATGQLPLHVLPPKIAKEDCIIGYEFSGRDCKGNRVMGMHTNGCLATTILMDKHFRWEVPTQWTLEEAATVPVCYATVYYALIRKGQMQPGESVLIHAGAGGVGQAAIRISLHMNCKVFTTVGSQEKRDFLKKIFPQIEDSCIGNSRDDSFEQVVLRGTRGRGVNLVLNSLANDLFQASLRCLAEEGRFLEIGKADMSNNTPLGMAVFLKRINFIGISLDQFNDDLDKQEIVRLLKEGIVSGAVQPLSRTVFTDSQAEQAFRFLASGKNLGKVLLKLREDDSTDVKYVDAVPRTYVDPNKSYVLIGGLGGIGLELTQWLVSRGATKLILNSRRTEQTGYQALCLRRWQERGIKVFVSIMDATTVSGAESLLEEALSLGPIGGIFNLAVVLRDALFENQTVANFQNVCQCKVEVTKHMDAVSRKMAPNLDYFVVFSSVACGRGNLGQSNYAYANSVMERICEKRQEDGLPGLAIQWGPVGDVGLVQDMMGEKNVEIGRTVAQSVASCLETMDVFLGQESAVVSSMVVAKPKSKTVEVSGRNLLDLVADILGINDVSSVPNSTTLGDLGMDSLMSTQINQIVELHCNVSLNQQEMRSLSLAKILEMQLPKEESNALEATSFTPSKCLIQMHKTQTKAAPVFFIHSIEATVKNLQTLAECFKVPVYGLQCSLEVPLSSIEEMAAYYITKIKSVQDKGPYTLVGYSFGTNVTLEIGLQLQKEREQSSLFLIDGSPIFLQRYLYAQLSCKPSVNTILDQSKTLSFLLSVYRKVDKQQHIIELAGLETFEERLEKTAIVLADEKRYSINDRSTFLRLCYNQLQLIERYEPGCRFAGPVTLFRTKDDFVDIAKDYGLAEICERKVDVYLFEADHRSIINSSHSQKIASLCRREC